MKPVGVRANGLGAAELLEASADGFVQLDAELRILWANRATAAMHGRDGDELIGRPIDEL